MKVSKWIVIYTDNTGIQLEKNCRSLEEAKDLAINLHNTFTLPVYLTYLIEEFIHDKT